MTDKPENKRVLAKDRTREKLLEAARVLFETEGYQATTIRDVARAAGMSTGAVFVTWKDKAALYRDIFHAAPVDPHIGRQALRLLARIEAGQLVGQAEAREVLEMDKRIEI